jgi:hypothetical protein
MMVSGGVADSIRLRSIAVVGTKIDQHGNQSLVKKVSANKKLFATEVKDTCNAYVVFKVSSHFGWIVHGTKKVEPSTGDFIPCEGCDTVRLWSRSGPNNRLT